MYGDCSDLDISCIADWVAANSSREENIAGLDFDPLPGGGFNNITPLAKDDLPSRSPVDKVGRKLGEAAAAAVALGGRARAAVITTARAPFARSVAAQLEEAAQEGGQGAELAAAKARADASTACPCEWFVADDPVSHTRYFVIQVWISRTLPLLTITLPLKDQESNPSRQCAFSQSSDVCDCVSTQGSDSLDSWITNVTFDPIPFEGQELGVKVHRGVYKAALALYDRLLPLIQDHLAGSPFATVTFTGHSLGGALATVLLLMYTYRGVLTRSTISPVYTFGSAAVFCETGGALVTELEGTDISTSQEEVATADLLTNLGLPEGAVRDVVMHRDIVPRAFACDYSLVADLLARVWSPFREHSSLHSARGVLYSFIGRMMVLQPAADLTFTQGEGPHPMLPEGSGLYTLRHPSLLGAAAPASLMQAADQDTGAETPTSLAAAVMAFMDTPHPLDILADHRAYGTDGAISRYHNPDNYTRALGAVLRSRRSSWADIVQPGHLQQRTMEFIRTRLLPNGVAQESSGP